MSKWTACSSEDIIKLKEIKLKYKEKVVKECLNILKNIDKNLNDFYRNFMSYPYEYARMLEELLQRVKTEIALREDNLSDEEINEIKEELEKECIEPAKELLQRTIVEIGYSMFEILDKELKMLEKYYKVLQSQIDLQKKDLERFKKPEF